MSRECETKPLLSVFIPAYNAEKTLRSVVKRIPESVVNQVKSIYIINDGSKDNTRVIAEELKNKIDKIQIVEFSRNSGYGAAVRKGVQLCLEDGSEIAVCLHSDGQYPPEYIPFVTEYISEGGWDIVQGSRIAYGSVLKRGMPLYKYVSGKILSFLEDIVFRNRMSDRHSGYMFYSAKALKTIDFNKLSDSFDFDLEVLASAYSAGLRVSEYPVPAKYGDEVSYLNPIGYGFSVLSVLCKYIRGRYSLR